MLVDDDEAVQISQILAAHGRCRGTQVYHRELESHFVGLFVDRGVDDPFDATLVSATRFILNSEEPPRGCLSLFAQRSKSETALKPLAG
jgi:hypothetical protein